MANEITKTVSLSFAKGTISAVTFAEASKNVTVSGSRYHRAVQNIGTAEEAIGLGELSTLGWGMFKNLDATNYVELRVATAGAKFAKLKPGESCLLRLGSGITAPFAISDTAACNLEYMIVED